MKRVYIVYDGRAASGDTDSVMFSYREDGNTLTDKQYHGAVDG